MKILESLLLKEINVNNYNDDAVQVLEGLDAVHKRLECILKLNRWNRTTTSFGEIVDNAVDEALSSFGDIIAVT